MGDPSDKSTRGEKKKSSSTGHDQAKDNVVDVMQFIRVDIIIINESDPLFYERARVVHVWLDFLLRLKLTISVWVVIFYSFIR